jgi:hypothetical protein
MALLGLDPVQAEHFTVPRGAGSGLQATSRSVHTVLKDLTMTFKGLAVPPAGAAPGSVAVRLAVKRLDLRVFQLSDALAAEGVARKSLLSSFHHPNIVRLIGYCTQSLGDI